MMVVAWGCLSPRYVLGEYGGFQAQSFVAAVRKIDPFFFFYMGHSSNPAFGAHNDRLQRAR